MFYFIWLNIMFPQKLLFTFFRMNSIYDDWTLSFMEDSFDLIIYKYFIQFLIYDFVLLNIWKHVNEFEFLLE